ncbi:DUF3054 domain-containing protein [Microbacterium sp. ZW T5_56]|uniref:DUF3054 domain-containing protein n=1 Tax=Microbacterium sp. ZW T5_56 TaxID=3378081 RepID=UPI003852E77E
MTTPSRPRSGAIVLAAALDVVLVLVFAAIGRASHDESAFGLGLLTTAWPFLAALGVGWVATLAWRGPFEIGRTGVPVWVITVVGGMLLRFVSGQGTALPFIIVATIVLGVTLVGWRAIAALIRRLRSR